VWRPDVCRPLAALGPVPLSWSSGTLATERFYLSFCRMTNEGEPCLVISFTNVLAFHDTISTLSFFTPLKPSLALKSTDCVVAIGIPLELHGRSRQRHLFTLVSSSIRRVRYRLRSWVSRGPRRRGRDVRLPRLRVLIARHAEEERALGSGFFFYLDEDPYHPF
jgi:hypothetical protein